MEWYILAIVAALAASISMICKKKALVKEHAMEFLTVHKLFEVLIVLFLIPFIDFNVSWSLVGLIYIVTLVGSVALLLVAKAYRHMDFSIVVPMYNLSPAFLVVLAFFILGEKLNLSQLLGIALLIVGAYAVELEPKSMDLKKPFVEMLKSKYLHFLFLALILISLSSIGEKYVLGRNVTPFTLLFLGYLFTFVNTFVLLSIFHDGFRGIKHGIKTAGWWIFSVAFFATIANLAYLYAISIAYVSLVVPVVRLSSLFATISSGKLFHEENVFYRVISCIVMLFGAYMVIAG